SVNHPFTPTSSCLVVPFDKRLAHADKGRDIAASFYLMVLGGNGRGTVRNHLRRTLRIDEFFPSFFAQRVKHHYRNVAFPRLLKLVQHTRGVGAYVLAKRQNTVGMLEIVK